MSGTMTLLACPFKKVLLSTEWHCANSERRVAVVESTLGCGCEKAWRRCREVDRLLRDSSRFVLKLRDTAGQLPNGAVLRIHGGGLRGLATLLDSDCGQSGVGGLVAAAVDRYGGASKIPFRHVLREIAAYRPRRRRRTPTPSGRDSD
jgi:hypothetical protein